MGGGEGVLVVLGDRLVEAVVFLLGDVTLHPESDGIDLVDGLPLPDLLSPVLDIGLFPFFSSSVDLVPHSSLISASSFVESQFYGPESIFLKIHD